MLCAAFVQAGQAAATLFAAVLAAIAATEGKSYLVSSGIAISVIGTGTAVALGFVAAGLARARHWSRTPAVLTQFFTGIVGIYLVQGGRYAWGVPALVLAVGGLALLFAPPSLRALTGEGLRERAEGGAGGESARASRRGAAPR